MTIYRCRNSDILEHVEIHAPHPEYAVATIVAKDCTVEQLEVLRDKLSKKNYSTLMDSEGGKNTIQVRGITNIQKFLSALRQTGMAGSALVKDVSTVEHTKAGFRDKVRGKSFFLSALFYELGNIACIVSGVQGIRHRKPGESISNAVSDMMVGVSFLIGDSLMAIYDTKGDEELQAANQGLRKHLHQKGIDIPLADTLNPDTLHQSGLFKATDRWLHKHIAHVKCLSEVAGGLFTIHSAMKPGRINEARKKAGLLITTGWLATFLLEKPRGSEVFKDTSSSLMPDSMESLVPQPILDNPRGWIARPAGMANNIFNLVGFMHGERSAKALLKGDVISAQQKLHTQHTPTNLAALNLAKATQHDYIWNVIAACSFLVGHSLFGISGSKKRINQTEDDKAMMNDLVLLSANMLAQQPEQVRKAAIDETAEYVAKLAHVELGKEQVAAAIHEKIDGLTRSGWVARVQAQSTPEQQPAL